KDPEDTIEEMLALLSIEAKKTSNMGVKSQNSSEMKNGPATDLFGSSGSSIELCAGRMLEML
ncbi:MAG: hypothetical protein PV344_03150, partial [Anaplasma sp.]|nr:hypothetical protein [Anaplasma sp.]